MKELEKINTVDRKLIEKELKKRQKEAEKILESIDKTEEFLQKLEKKLSEIPEVGEFLSYIPVFASLIRNYVYKEYTDIPYLSIIAIVGALLYFLSPIDLLPDAIGGIGYADDALVIAICLKMVETDLELYDKWRAKNGKIV